VGAPNETQSKRDDPTRETVARFRTIRWCDSVCVSNARSTAAYGPCLRAIPEISLTGGMHLLGILAKAQAKDWAKTKTDNTLQALDLLRGTP